MTEISIVNMDRTDHQGTKRYHVQKQYKDGGWGTFAVTNSLEYAQSRAVSMQKYTPVRIVDYGEV